MTLIFGDLVVKKRKKSKKRKKLKDTPYTFHSGNEKNEDFPWSFHISPTIGIRIGLRNEYYKTVTEEMPPLSQNIN